MEGAQCKDMEHAQQLYDSNLALLMDKVRTKRRGMHRVMMAQSGLIQSILPCRAGKPQAGCFTLFIPGGTKSPRFGTLDHLQGFQGSMAKLMIADVGALLKTSEVAYILQTGTSPVLDRQVQNTVDDLAERFGQLPEPALKRVHDGDRVRRLQEEERMRKVEERQREKERVLDETPTTSIFEQLLQRELAIEAQRKKQVFVG